MADVQYDCHMLSTRTLTYLLLSVLVNGDPICQIAGDPSVDPFPLSHG